MCLDGSCSEWCNIVVGVPHCGGAFAPILFSVLCAFCVNCLGIYYLGYGFLFIFSSVSLVISLCMTCSLVHCSLKANWTQPLLSSDQRWVAGSCCSRSCRASSILPCYLISLTHNLYLASAKIEIRLSLYGVIGSTHTSKLSNLIYTNFNATEYSKKHLQVSAVLPVWTFYVPVSDGKHWWLSDF